MDGLIINNTLIDVPIIEILKKLRYESNGRYLNSIEDKGSYCIITCPFHKDGHENRPSCSVNYNDSNTGYGVFHCFTCGEKGPLWVIVSHILGISENAAKQWLIDNFGFTHVVDNSLELPEWVLEDETESSGQEYHIYDDSILDTFEDYHPYMTQRHLTDEIIKKFKIKYDPKSKSIVFPNYDLKGNLVQLTKRSVDSKKFDLGKGLDKSIIYLLKNVIEDGYNYCVVCESQLNALTCWTWGLPAIGLYGAGPTKSQMDVLNKSPIQLFILAYDPDDAGRKGANNFKKLIRSDKFVTELKIPKGKDVNDLSKEEFLNLLIDNDLDFLINN